MSCVLCSTNPHIPGIPSRSSSGHRPVGCPCYWQLLKAHFEHVALLHYKGISLIYLPPHAVDGDDLTVYEYFRGLVIPIYPPPFPQ